MKEGGCVEVNIRNMREDGLKIDIGGGSEKIRGSTRKREVVKIRQRKGVRE